MLQGRAAWLRVGVVLALLLAFCAGPALAQNDDKADEPWLDVPNLEWKKPWLQWVVGLAFAATCLGLAFKNPHRSHLD